MGTTIKVLQKLADDLEKQREFKGKVKGALIYPAIVVVGMIVVSAIMVVFVVPKLVSLYSQFGASLPLSTRIMLGFSKAVTNYWFVWIIAGLLLFWGFTIYKKTGEGKRRLGELALNMPLIGELQREVILTEITRTLSLMVGAGVPIIEGINITAGVIGNVVVSDALTDVGRQVEKGFPISFAFSKHPEAFPQILVQMISVGEETGKMEDVLSKLSHVFEVESEQRVKALTSAIEPVVMIFLGIGVALLVISVIIPIYNLTSVI